MTDLCFVFGNNSTIHLDLVEYKNYEPIIYDFDSVSLKIFAICRNCPPAVSLRSLP